MRPVQTVDRGAAASKARLLFVVTCFLWFSVYVYSPILSPYSESIGASYTQVGMILSSYGFVQMVCRIPIGVLSDALRRRKVFIVAGMFFGMASAAGLFFAHTPELLLFFRGMSGLAASTWAIYMTMYNSLFSAERRAGSMGKISSAMLIGQVTASFLGGLVAEYAAESLTFLVAAAAGAVGLAMTLLLPEPREAKKEPLRVRSFVGLLGNGNLIFYSAMAILLQLAAYTGAFGFIPNILRDLGASNFILGLATTLTTLPGAVSSWLSGTWMLRALGMKRSLMLGFAVMAATLYLTVLTGSVAVILLLLVLYGFARGSQLPLLTSAAVGSVPAALQSTAASFFQSVYGIGMTLGPILSGLIADHFGMPAAFFAMGTLTLSGALWVGLKRETPPAKG